MHDHFLWELQYTHYEKLSKDLVEYLSATKNLGGESSHGGRALVEIGMVKSSQYDKKQHQQNKVRGDGKVTHHRQSCELFEEPGHAKKDCWYAKKGQPPSGIGKGKSGQGSKGKGKGKNADDQAQPE